MKKWMMALTVVLVVCLSADMLFAPEGEEGAPTRRRAREEGRRAREAGPRAMGQVKSVDVEGGKIVVAVRQRGQREATETTFKITKETKVLFEQEEKTLADLAAGKNVMISYKAAAEEGGEAVALTITMRMPRAFGTLKSVDADGGKIVVTMRARRGQEATETTFLVDKNTTVRIGREEKTLADLTEGAGVIISYKEAEKKDGNPTAVSIMVRAARARRARTNTDTAR